MGAVVILQNVLAPIDHVKTARALTNHALNVHRWTDLVQRVLAQSDLVLINLKVQTDLNRLFAQRRDSAPKARGHPFGEKKVGEKRSKKNRTDKDKGKPSWSKGTTSR